MRNCIIVDLDGTLANCDHRRHHLETKDWPAFYAGMGDDKPNHWCHHMLLKMRGDLAVVITTGRPEEFRGHTEAWLQRYNVEYDALFMRKSKDYRKDSVIKEDILKERHTAALEAAVRGRRQEAGRRHVARERDRGPAVRRG